MFAVGAAIDQCMRGGYRSTVLCAGVGIWDIALLEERRTRDRQVESSIPPSLPPPPPGSDDGRIFFSRVNFPVLTLLYGVRSIPVLQQGAHKRPRSFRQKCRWQVTAKTPIQPCPKSSQLAESRVEPSTRSPRAREKPEPPSPQVTQQLSDHTTHLEPGHNFRLRHSLENSESELDPSPSLTDR